MVEFFCAKSALKDYFYWSYIYASLLITLNILMF